jgi:short-subunit dehydrogenase
MPFEFLHGRTVLLTGATGGLGRHIAGALARSGAHLALSARDEAALRELAETLRPAGVRCVPVPADLTDRHSVTTLAERAEEAIGPLDILINNAVTEHRRGLEHTTRQQVDDVVDVNLRAPLELTRHAVTGMLERGRGHVVFVASVSGLTGTAYLAPYAATKGALIALGHSLRAEYGDRPIGFSVVTPGSVAGAGMFARAQADGVRPPRALRLTSPDAVARAVLRAITSDAPHLLPAAGPVRPALVLGLLSPRLAERLHARLGLARLFATAAQEEDHHAPLP